MPVTVPGPDCLPVGTLQRASDGTWVTDSVPGLTGRIESHPGPFGSCATTPGIEGTQECGGFLAH